MMGRQTKQNRIKQACVVCCSYSLIPTVISSKAIVQELNTDLALKTFIPPTLTEYTLLCWLKRESEKRNKATP